MAKPYGCITVWPVPNSCARSFTSLRVTRFTFRGEPRRIMSTFAKTRKKTITRRFGRWRSNGFGSSIAAGRTANPTTRRSTCNPSADVALCLPRYDMPNAISARTEERSGENPDGLPSGSGGNHCNHEDLFNSPFCLARVDTLVSLHKGFVAGRQSWSITPVQHAGYRYSQWPALGGMHPLPSTFPTFAPRY